MPFSNQSLAAIRKAHRLHRKRRDGAAHQTAFNKPEINAAIAAVRSRVVALRGALSLDIETAAPGKFTNSDKKLLVAEIFNELFIGDVGRSRR